MDVAVLAIVMMTIAYKISTALDKCTDEGEWRKSTSPAKKAEEMQIEACAITAGSLIVQHICHDLSPEANTCHRFMLILHGEHGRHVDHCVSILWCSSLPPQFGHFGPGPLGMRSLYLYEYFGALGGVAVTACWCLQAGHIYLHGSFIKENLRKWLPAEVSS